MLTFFPIQLKLLGQQNLVCSLNFLNDSVMNEVILIKINYFFNYCRD